MTDQADPLRRMMSDRYGLAECARCGCRFYRDGGERLMVLPPVRFSGNSDEPAEYEDVCEECRDRQDEEENPSLAECESGRRLADTMQGLMDMGD